MSALALTVACHSYRPTSQADLSKGGEVRVVYPEPRRVEAISESGATFSVDSVRMVQGEPVGMRGDTLRLRVIEFYTGDHWRAPKERLELAVPPGSVLERNQLNGGRTAVLVGSITVVVLLTVAFLAALATAEGELGP